MEFRLLSSQEIKKFMDINREEVVEETYLYNDGRLVLEKNYFDIPDWTKESKQETIADIQELYDRGGKVWAAFEKDLLIGLITLDSRFLGDNRTLMNLNGLWVSKDYRKQGVATRLMELLKQEAMKQGAEGLYVSSTESKNTVEFYLNHGFELAKKVDSILFEREPRDIHMILRF